MLYSAVEGIAIAVGEALNPVLKAMTDRLTTTCIGIADYITVNKELVVSVAKTITKIIAVGVALMTVGGGIVVFGKSIGIIATAIASVAKMFFVGLGVFQMGISAIAGAFAALSFAVGSFASVLGAIFSAIGAAIGAILSPIGLAALGIGIIAGACYLAYRNANLLGDIFSRAFESLDSVVRSVASKISKTLGDIYQYFLNFYDTGAILKGVNLVSGNFERLGKIFGKIFRFGVRQVALLADTLWNLILSATKIGAVLATTLISGISAARSAISAVFGDFDSIIF